MKLLSIHRYINIFFFLLIGSFIFQHQNVLAQSLTLDESAEFEILGDKNERIVIPFELINNLVIIEVSINDSNPLKLILDTGVGNILVTSLRTRDEILLNSSRTVYLSGLGEGEAVEAFYSEENTIDIENVRGHNLEVLFLKEDIFQLSSFMGTFVHGLIGYDIFANFAVEINYLSKEIFLYDTEAFEEKFEKLERHRKWFRYPIDVIEKKPYINLDYIHHEGAPQTSLRLLIDSGSSNAFSLYDATHPNIEVPENTISTLIGVGLSGLVRGEIGRIEEMRLGEFVFDEPVIAYPDSNAIREVVSLGDRNGSIGGEVLRRFKTIFHYKDEYLLIRSNRDLGDNFHYNLSGIEVNTPVPDIPIYVVSDVRSGSPADRQGVQMGDIIKFINGESTASMNLNELIEILQKKRSSKVRIGVERDTLFKSFTFRLDDELQVDDQNQ